MPHSSCGPSHHVQGSCFRKCHLQQLLIYYEETQGVLIIFRILVIGFRKDALCVLCSQTHSPFPSFMHVFACDLFLVSEALSSGLS